MRFDAWTLALQAINFLVLVWLLRRFLYKPMLAAIARRQAEIAKELQDASSTQTAAETLRHELAEQRAGIAEERDRLLREAQGDAERERTEILARGKAEAERLIADARARIERERGEAAGAVTRSAAELAVEIARRLLAAAANGQPAALPFVERICARIRTLPGDERVRLREQARETDAVTLVTAVPLLPDEAERARGLVGDALGSPVAARLDSDPALIAGAELHFPHAILRDNWRNALTEILPTLVAADDDAARRA